MNLRSLIEKLVSERVKDVGNSPMQVTIDIGSESIVAETEGLALALRNLLDNAIKFTHRVAQPRVEIGDREQDGKCILWVRDNGSGFDMQHRERIFEIFQRLHRAGDYPGTGNGLALVRKAVDRMNGRVWAESAQGQGAAFFMEISKFPMDWKHSVHMTPLIGKAG